MAGKKEYQARAQVFEMLYTYYQEPVNRYLMARIPDKERAYEFCQDTFVRLWNFLLSQETISQPIAYYKNWLYKIATNLAIDHYRHNKLISFLPIPEGEAELSIEGDEERILERLWLQEVVSQMPQQQRECLLANHYWGYKQNEIAVKLEITESAVSAYVSRGKTELRRKYYPVPIDLRQWNAHIECCGYPNYRMTDDLKTTEAWWVVHAVQESKCLKQGVTGNSEWWKKFTDGVKSGEIKLNVQSRQDVTISEMRKLMHLPPNFPERSMQRVGRVSLLPETNKRGISNMLFAFMVIKRS